MTCMFCKDLTAAGCEHCRPGPIIVYPSVNTEPHNPWDFGTVAQQLIRIESKLDELLARKKRVVKAKGSADDYPEWFEKIWAEYPKRSGSNPKRKAFDACNSRVKEAFKINGYVDCADYLWSRTVDYCKYCDAVYQDKRYVMQAATFYGYSKPYEGDFTIPAGQFKSQVPKDNEEMQRWAIKRGLRPAYQTESWAQYRAFVEDAS